MRVLVLYRDELNGLWFDKSCPLSNIEIVK